jgi:hypothetical protein
MLNCVERVKKDIVNNYIYLFKLQLQENVELEEGEIAEDTEIEPGEVMVR